MARGQEPLLAQRPPSENEDGLEEEDALLTGQRTTKGQQSPTAGKWREIGLFIWALLATAAVIVLAVVYQHSQAQHSDPGDVAKPSGKRNLIFMVSDGMGPTSLSLTRSWRQYVDALPYDDTLILDKHLIGQSRTRSSNTLVTDSAAGATAFSCGMKSYNGAISVLPDHTPCGTVLEAAKRAGYMTGLVVTTRITDATPACFASHVRVREMEDDIAMQLIGVEHPLGRNVDLMLGGGRCHFLPNSSEGGCRNDGNDVTAIAEEKGWNYISTRDDFDNLGTSVELPLLGLFARGDIPFEIDRRFEDDAYPSLEEMAKTALKALSAATQDSDKGFFIMIEGSRIDHAGHLNDPAAQVHEVLAYDRTMQAVLDFIAEEETETLMVSTSDHETGGLATARQLHITYPDYLWYPGVLANASHSAEHLAHQYHVHLQSQPKHGGPHVSSEDTRAYLSILISKGLSINDASQDELDRLIQHPVYAVWTFADMISRRSQTGWSTHGHSAADVNIYTSDKHAAKALVGNHENTEVGEFLRTYLGLGDEVEKITKKLRKHMEIDVNWLGNVPETKELPDWEDGEDHLEDYHGDHRRRSAGQESQAIHGRQCAWVQSVSSRAGTWVVGRVDSTNDWLQNLDEKATLEFLREHDGSSIANASFKENWDKAYTWFWEFDDWTDQLVINAITNALVQLGDWGCNGFGKVWHLLQRLDDSLWRAVGRTSLAASLKEYVQSLEDWEPTRREVIRLRVGIIAVGLSIAAATVFGLLAVALWMGF